MLAILLAMQGVTPCPLAETVIYACQQDSYGNVDKHYAAGVPIKQVAPTRNYTVGAEVYSDKNKDVSVNYRIQDANGYKTYKHDNAVGVTVRFKF